jgi:hypothetical protein
MTADLVGLADKLDVIAQNIARANINGFGNQVTQVADELRALAGAEVGGITDTARLDYIEHRFSGMTNRERYLPVQMIWGKGAMGRTLREACDKYMESETPPPGSGRGGVG